MPLVAHVSPCGRLLNERGQRGGDVAPVKWTFNYLPWLNTTQSECTQYRSPSSFTFPSALHPMPRHTSCVYFLGVADGAGRGGKGARSATALAASYSNYLSYRRFDFHAARPSWVPENPSPNRMQHAARSQHFWQLTVASAAWWSGGGAGAERMCGWARALSFVSNLVSMYL